MYQFCGLSPLLSSRLIALDKCPRIVIGKAILCVIKPDVQGVAGSVQLYAGQTSGYAQNI